MDDLIGLAVMLSLPGYVALQWHATSEWEGAWRLSAFVPMVIMGALVIHATFAFMA